jgi:hypothetical protein
MKYKYLVIHADADGIPNTWMKDEVELNEYLSEFDEDYKVEILEDFPEQMDTNYWKEDTILILCLEDIVIPKIKLSV